jgi:hypothetical protein
MYPITTQHDDKLRTVLTDQITDPTSIRCGGVPDKHGLCHANSAGRLLKDAAAAFFHPESKFRQDPALLARMQSAIAFLDRLQTVDGNVDLLTTNFNSPPDTGFVVQNVATAAKLAQTHGDQSTVGLMEPFLRRAGQAMARGGIHTPNHRWVICSALAQINDLFPDERLVRRIDAWLAEGIDIDEHGQYIERSTTIYNAVTNTALVIMARKLNRPALLEAVRKNLDAMAYLLHPGGEVVTEISRRQDLNTRGDLSHYWFSLRTLAIADQNGIYAAMLAPLEPDRIDLALLMEYPELQGELPEAGPIPDDYEKSYPKYGLTRIRRADTSVGIMHTGQSRWVSLRQGNAVISAIRLASAFFGKGQFIPTDFGRREDGFYFSQKLEAGYFQPVKKRVNPEDWRSVRADRHKSETCRMVYEGIIRETRAGFEITIRASGTDGVPLAIEVALRAGGEVLGVEPVPDVPDAFLLNEGQAEYRMGGDVIRFGPGRAEHAYTAVRGAESKPTGPCVYLTGFTPFEHTLVFAMR